MANEFRILQMNEDEARTVCTWKYPGELAIYNYSDWEECRRRSFSIADAAKREKHYFSVYRDDRFFGFINIMDKGDHVELGVAMKPEECGKHNGRVFIEAAVAKIKELHPGKNIYLTVLTFNRRAVTCYQSAGFQIIRQYYDAQSIHPGQRFLMEYRPHQDQEQSEPLPDGIYKNF